jgi:predicted MFS family arabinose efflux permease
MLQGRASDEWRQHWKVVVGAFAGTVLVTTAIISVGVMIAPIETELGWSRAQISSGQFIVSIIAVLCAPLVGLAIDRYGPRRIGVPGSILVCFALALLSRATPDIRSWWALWGLLGFASLLVKPTVWMAGVSSLFSASRGIALAVTLSGTSLAIGLTPIAGELFLEHYGWRGAYVALGLMWAIICIPPILFLFSSAKDAGRRSDLTNGPATQPAMTGLSVGQGFTSARFYKLAVASVMSTFVSISFIANMVPILTFTGLSRLAAVADAGLIGLSALVGRLCIGYLLDRFNANAVAALSILLPIVASLLLIKLPGAIGPAAIAAALVGISSAALDVGGFLAARHLGMRSFGALFGTIAGLITFTSGAVPLLVNYIYDRTGSYYPVLWGLMPFCIAAAVLYLSLGKYPKLEMAPVDNGLRLSSET